MSFEDVPKYLEQATKAINIALNLRELDEIRVQYLGKNGLVTSLMKELANLSLEEKKEFGSRINIIKESIITSLDAKRKSIEKQILDEQLSSEKIDVTLPIRPQIKGRIHPLTQVIDEVTAIFGSLGFKVAEGPDIEDDFHNFTALNIPEIHPARQLHDTFYLNKIDDQEQQMLLRTHTSSIQIRNMEQNKPPFRIIAPDRCYRCDWDITHTPMFHQIEGLLIDENINMGHLKGTIINFIKAFFEVEEVPIRFRASYFPFTEPSAEVDIGCSWKGKELVIGEGGDWLEILGCGMVHPNVLRNVGIDPEKYQGFAFGMGLERLAMLKYGIADLRTFFDGDVRWINHYGFSPFDIPSLIRGLTR